jgi:hypothetical protein
MSRSSVQRVIQTWPSATPSTRAAVPSKQPFTMIDHRLPYVRAELHRFVSRVLQRQRLSRLLPPYALHSLAALDVIHAPSLSPAPPPPPPPSLDALLAAPTPTLLRLAETGYYEQLRDFLQSDAAKRRLEHAAAAQLWCAVAAAAAAAGDVATCRHAAATASRKCSLAHGFRSHVVHWLAHDASADSLELARTLALEGVDAAALNAVASALAISGCDAAGLLATAPAINAECLMHGMWAHPTRALDAYEAAVRSGTATPLMHLWATMLGSVMVDGVAFAKSAASRLPHASQFSDEALLDTALACGTPQQVLELLQAQTTPITPRLRDAIAHFASVAIGADARAIAAALARLSVVDAQLPASMAPVSEVPAPSQLLVDWPAVPKWSATAFRPESTLFLCGVDRFEDHLLELQAMLAPFGTVLRVVPERSLFVFVEFVNAESVDQVLAAAARKPFELGGRKLIVDRKRAPGQAGSSLMSTASASK